MCKVSLAGKYMYACVRACVRLYMHQSVCLSVWMDACTCMHASVCLREMCACVCHCVRTFKRMCVFWYDCPRLNKTESAVFL